MREKIQELRGLVRGGTAPRELLLAYAFVRGVAYHRVELTTRTPIWLRRVAELSGQPEDVVLAWLQVPPTPELLERAAAARAVFFAAKEERRRVLVAERTASLGIPA